MIIKDTGQEGLRSKKESLRMSGPFSAVNGRVHQKGG